MELQTEHPTRYLAEDDVIDFSSPMIRECAQSLRSAHPDDVDFTKAAFEYVRDTVRHSWDAHDPRVTVSASDALSEGVGLCYAKAHLLAAILRSESIPTGLCYQRLTDDGEYFMVHGLVAVFLNGNWHRQDPRGNRPGVDAQFSLDVEQLAWPVRPELGEADYLTVYTEPNPGVITVLRQATNILDLCESGLPDSL